LTPIVVCMDDLSTLQPGSVAPAPPISEPVPTRSDTRGRTALVLAITVIVLSVLASVAIGLFATTIYHYREVITSGGHSTTQVGFRVNAAPVAGGLQVLFGSILGLTALIMGIVATVQNRGRRYGIIAMIVAVAAPILSAIVFSIVGGIAGHNVYQ
jgi:ABC-type polysaccharide/polyol phosphate export permease